MGAGHEQQHLPVAARPPVFARTKFLAPQLRTTLVPRDELVERLLAADHLPLTLVVGSPGSGKSSLLAQWFRAADDGSVGWLAADRGDEDPSRFWRGLISAVQQVDPTFGVEAADLITLDGHVSHDVLEALLVADAALDDRVRLVIDDFHLVSLDAAQQLQHLLERGLSSVRLLIGSRSDPAIGLPRLRVQGHVVEIREHDLRLDLDETRALLANIGLDPDSVDVQALLDRTEGWAAGLQMAALSVLGAPDPAARVRELAGTTQTIAGYLTSEVVANQPAHVQQFLEDTCVADELDVALCNALTDASHDGERVTLESIEAANLLLTRVDAAGTTFRYHHLFGEMLRNRLQSKDPERSRQQHGRAADHYVATGDVNHAVRHLWYAGRADEGAQLLRDQLIAVYLDPGAPPRVDPSMVPPDDALLRAPANAVGYGVGLILNGHTQLATTLFRRAAVAAATVDLPPLDRLHIVGARLIGELATGSTGVAADLTREFVALMDQDLADDAWVAVTLPFGIRAAIWEGDLELADALLRRVPAQLDPRVAGIDVAGVHAMLDLERGNVHSAIDRARAAHAAARSAGVESSGPALAAAAVLGAALVDAGHLTEAEPLLASVIRSPRVERAPSYLMAVVASSRLLRAQGSFDAAARLFDEARTRLRNLAPGPTLITRLDLAELAVRLVLGEVDEAQRLLERARPGLRTDVAAAWVATIRRDWQSVDALEATLSRSARTHREQLDVSLLQLRVALDRGAPNDDIDRLADSLLELAEQTGFVLPVAEAGAAVLQAAVGAARRRLRTPFVEHVLATRPLPRPADQARPEHHLDELSNRELIVLRYMVTSMSNQEIADALYLSVNTVKTHIKHVLRKLNATSRSDATRRAQELHYL